MPEREIGSEVDIEAIKASPDVAKIISTEDDTEFLRLAGLSRHGLWQFRASSPGEFCALLIHFAGRLGRNCPSMHSSVHAVVD